MSTAHTIFSLCLIYLCLLIIGAFLQLFFPASQDDPKDEDDESH